MTAMGKRVTLADVAQESQVSVSTVSLALRDKPGIPPETRERVLRAAYALGYRSDQPKATVIQEAGPNSRSRSLGVIVKTEPNVPPQGNPFYSHVLAGIADACLNKRIHLLYTHLRVDGHNLPIEVPPVLTGDVAEGVFLVGMYVSEPLQRMLQERNLPVVLVDSYTSSDIYDAVVSDNFGGAYQAVNYLVKRGHRHIGIVGSGPNAYPSIRERREGYLKALSDSGIDATYCADCVSANDEPVEASRALLQQHPEVTALFTANDSVAIAVMRAAQAMGRRLPADLSIVSFDDIDTAQYLTPALTTMRVDKVGMGRMAVQLLINRLEFPDSSLVTAVLRPHLVERDSVISLPA